MLITPFDRDGLPDTRSLSRLVDHVVASGAEGVAAFGLASEAHALSEGERRRLTELIVADLAGRLPLVVTVTAESTILTVDLARHAERSGAAAIMVAPPHRIHAEPSALARHYSTVAEAVALPLIIQDAPGYIGSSLGCSLIAQLIRQHSNILYIKTEALPAGASIAELRDHVGEAVGIFSGTGGLYLLDTLEAGADGTIPGSDIPEFLVPIVEAYRDGRQEEARELFRHVLPLLVYQLQSLELCIACTKAVLMHRGIIAHADLRSPGLTLSRQTHAQLMRLYGEVNEFFARSRPGPAQPFPR